ncbi:AbrB family transcriptional regulator [Litoreibacter albidus]|uniref:AbrB family transcriptional regulator n=1 Tax=Litoreibacter albidus TaxID=670155 RepID=UPI0037356BC2
MFALPTLPAFGISVLALLVGAIGAALGYLVSLPLYMLTGPAVIVSLASLFGLKLEIAPLLRDIAFLFIGIGIGAGVNAEAAAAMLRWPLAFVALAVMLVLAMILCRAVLVRAFGFDARSAVLASAPGHLSFVIALGEAYRVDLARVTVGQSIRVLLLTLTVPAIAALMGVDLSEGLRPQGDVLGVGYIAVLVVLSLIAGVILNRLKVPAPLLIGAMLVSSIGHLTDLSPGVLEPKITMACLVLMGTLIGSRFGGISPALLFRYAGGGVVITILTAALSLAFSVPVAMFLDMPLTHVLVAFAPGGLETMIVMGAVLGANPGFVAACHVGRLLVLSVLVPVMAARARDR